MPFDPNIPATNAELTSPMFRGQFQGLKALIDAIPAGPQGIPGPPGPSVANAIVDGVSTAPTGSPAAVGVSFDGTNVHFTFNLPQGNDGPPGEVTNAQLSTAIGGTSSNSNGVAMLDTPFTNDPPTLADMETMRAAYNALVLALRR